MQGEKQMATMGAMSPDTRFHLAQVNIGRARGETTAPVMAGFMARLADINALAERTPGFIWRLQTDEGDATAVRPGNGDSRIMINMSVWGRFQPLTYVYRSAHAEVMKRRREWFEEVRARLRGALVGAGRSPAADCRGGGAARASRAARADAVGVHVH